MAKDFLTIDPKRANVLARKGSAIIVRRITEKTALIAAAKAPGSMKDKIRPVITGGGNPLGIVMVDHPAASFVLQGTKPHEIVPRKRGGVLRFEVGGVIVYTKKVWHPGTKANNFLWEALVSARM